MEDLGTHYFGQTEGYFSLSEQRFIDLDQMAMPHLRNAMHKLLREYGQEFWGSPLHEAMVAKLRPEREELENVLRQYGAASFYIGDDFPSTVPRVRSMFYRVGKSVGVKVKTRMDGDFMKAEVNEPVNITVRKH